MIILGAGLLTWYYSNAFSRQSRNKQAAQSAALHRAQGEMPLPAFEGFNLLKATSESQQTRPLGTEGQQVPKPQPPLANQPVLAEPQLLPLMPAQTAWIGAPSQRMVHGGRARKSSEQLTLERLLAGAAFSRESAGRSGTVEGRSTATESTLAGGTFDAVAGRSAEPAGSDGTIEPFLHPTAIASARAKVLPTRRFLLSKGAFIDCTLETAIDSTLPGMTTCVTATDTFSADGTVVLLERGTKLIGETRGQVQQGTARVFVLWTEARTPTGIVVPLDSPGADELGRSGLPGSVNRHFWDRFGAAILISTLDGAVQAAVESASRGGGPVIYNPSGSASVLTDVLKSSVNIPPTVTKANGERIQVFVARDVDFRSVYELKSVTPAK
jgi:type IV secretion system protein VirB10